MAYVLENQVSHTRFLPIASRHSFVYPTLSLLVSLNSLEDRQLDLLRGWVFGYGTTWGRLTGVHPSGYLYGGRSDTRSIRGKLVHVLDEQGYPGGELHDAWLMTMPSFLGVEGINPLSVYFCYRRSSPVLWLVVLEVHNTFSERHVYVLATSDESKQSAAARCSRFDHQWLFPRQFHVSPFNDRSGHYLCQITAPPHPPPSICNEPPRPVVKITLLTAPPHAEKKLVAILRATRSAPLSSTALLSALARAPFALLLSFPRIAYQAYILHYHKRLDVYQRPDPCVADPAVEPHLPPARNAIQPPDVRRGVVGRGVGWQHVGPLERWCERRVHAFLHRKRRETNVSVVFVPAYPRADAAPKSSSNSTHTLTIYHRSPRVFTLLFTMPSAMHAILLGVHGDGLFAVSSEALFCETFAAPPSAPPSAPPPSRLHVWGRRLALRIRRLLVPPDPEHATDGLPVPPLHALDDDPVTGATVGVLLVLLALAVVEKTAFGVIGARFVRGDEPWGGWARLRSNASSSSYPRDKLGSVRREEAAGGVI